MIVIHREFSKLKKPIELKYLDIIVKKSGELDVPGNPILYTTTDIFLEKTGFQSIDELPSIGEYFSSPAEEE